MLCWQEMDSVLFQVSQKLFVHQRILCTVKYSLSMREIQRAEPEGFPEGSGYVSPYIPTWVMIKAFSISNNYTFSMSFLVGKYWKGWFSILVSQLWYTFPYCPVDDTIRVRIDQVENSVVAALGNTRGQESNTQVGIYGEIYPEPSGNPSGSALGISHVLTLYFTVYIYKDIFFFS